MPAFSRMMLERNIAVVVVGYPATPLTSSRVRLCVSSSLTKDDLDKLLIAIDEVGTSLNLKMSQEVSPITGQLFRSDLKDVLPTLVEDAKKDWKHLY
jgi:serine palmitoyltransferase